MKKLKSEREVIEMLTKLRDEIGSGVSALKSFMLLNGLAPRIHWCNKIVIEVEGSIFKIENPKESYKRILLNILLGKHVPQIYLPCEVFEDLSNEIFVVTKEPKVDVVAVKHLDSTQQEALFKKVLGLNNFNALNNALKLYGVLPITSGNFGLDKKGDIKVFDWIANVTAEFLMPENKWVLKNQMGAVLYDSSNK